MNNPAKNKKPELSDDNLTIHYDIDDFSANLPHLTDEIQQIDHPGKIDIDSLSFEDAVPEDPCVEDFLRRCSTKSEALEIISYLEASGELSSNKAMECRDKLEKQGLEIFGPHKEHGYYEKNYRRNRKFSQL